MQGALPFRRDGDRLYGPGLFDMKGGAYLALEAFRQVAQAKSAKLPVTFVFTPDEEVGSPTSRHIIESEAKGRALRAGDRAGARRRQGRHRAQGRRPLRDEGHGVPAHSGARHQDGRSAIREMARQILAIEEMTDYARGVTTTVGVIAGGTAPNVIPQHCRITVDLRVRDVAAGEEFEAKILGLAPVDPGVKLEVTGGMNRPPFEKSAAIDVLFRHAQASRAASASRSSTPR